MDFSGIAPKVLSAALAVAAALYSQPVFADQAVSLQDAELTGDEVIQTPYGEITLTHNFVTGGQDTLFDAMDFQRASQAYIWSTPAVSIKQWMKIQTEDYGADKLGDFVFYNSLREKRSIVTANLTTPYIIGFLSLAEGAVRIEVPAGAMAGMFMDVLQRPVADIGLTGPDAGNGGSYIIVGPSEDLGQYEGQADFVFQSVSNSIMIGIRLLDPSPEFGERVKRELKIGRVGGSLVAANIIQGVDEEYSATAPRGLAYWELLAQIINEEPIREQDRAFVALLEPLGIKKGEPFEPNERQARILKQGAAMGELMLRNLQTNPRFTEPYWDGTNWYKSFDFTVPQMTATKVEIDERAVWFYEAVTSSEGMVNPTPGKGQVYMTTKRDSNGDLFRADRTYRLRVPAEVPVGQFWSLTLYSENTRRPYDNGLETVRSINLGSRLEDLRFNEDGSVDLFIGPKAPEGYEKNLMTTTGTDGWFVYFRLYAPLEPWFDKTFRLPDFEVVN